MIEFINVSKVYNGRRALDEINFEIEEGEFVFLVGPSGSGKTSIIRLLIKEEEPTTGEIFFYDSKVNELKGNKISQLRREISVVFQDFKLLPQKNLYENVAFVLEVAGRSTKDIKETVPYVLDLVELGDRMESFPDELSGGEKQKIAIARAIANNPKVLIADEPTGNLDPESSWEIINLLQKINEWGTTVIMATHGTDIVNSLEKRVIHLNKGRLVEDNKQGIYPTQKVAVEIKKELKTETKKTEKEIDKDKLEKKEEPEASKKVKKKPKVSKDKASDKEETFEPKQVNDIEEKEFEISFTTKPKLPSKGKTKKKGKDVVDLNELDLPEKIQEALIKGGIPSIKKLKKAKEEDLLEIKGITKKDTASISKALEKKS